MNIAELEQRLLEQARQIVGQGVTITSEPHGVSPTAYSFTLAWTAESGQRMTRSILISPDVEFMTSDMAQRIVASVTAKEAAE